MDTKKEEPKTEEKKEEAKTESKKDEENKIDETKTEETKSEEKKEEAKSEELKPEQKSHNGKPAISFQDIDNYKKEYDLKPMHRIIQNVLAKNKITKTIKINDSRLYNRHIFEIDIPTMRATNQQSSGRCWIFAGLNVLREIVGKKLKISEFELSQNYIAFYDKFEKINYTLESIIELCPRDYDDRTLSYILKEGVQDGGQWDMFANIVKKYGVVPKVAMDETEQSSNTREGNFVIKNALRIFAAKASKLYREGKKEEIQNEKKIILSKLFNFLCMCFGKPVEKFNFEYMDSSRKYHFEKDLTPLSFYNKYLSGVIDQYVSVVNAPTSTKPFYNLFTIKYTGNVVGGKKITYLNLPMNEVKDLCLKQLKAGELIWFGSDSGKYRDDMAVWDDKMYDYKNVFDIDLKAEKGDMLDYQMSAMDHAMVITGVSFKEEGKPGKWKIENSWGPDKANGGYYLMTDSWFDNFVYQVVINKKHLSKEQLEVLDKKYIELEPWDPMGTLAL